MLDYIRLACAVPAVKVGDVVSNVRDICSYMEKADAQNADVLIFPELSLTGATCGDLFFQTVLWEKVREGLRRIVDCSRIYPQMSVVAGLPVAMGPKLFNCAAVIRGGSVRGVVPKAYLSEEDKRWFSSGLELQNDVTFVELFGDAELGTVSFGCDQLFSLGDGCYAGIQIGEDALSPLFPAGKQAIHGANILLHLSAEKELVGRRTSRRELAQYQSASLCAIFASVCAGSTESTSDYVYSGHSLIAQGGRILWENEEQIASGYMLVGDCDAGCAMADRIRNCVFRDVSVRLGACDCVVDSLSAKQNLRSDGTMYPLRKLAFIPSQKVESEKRCLDIFNMQVVGLKQRLSGIGANAVIGISGGLDSTLALLVAVEAMRQLGRPATDVHGVTMPCFGTSDRTYHNSWELMRTLGISCKEINIREAVNIHFRDIGHDPSKLNATYENSQARERTQILMDYASVVGGIVVGTGDLSELALGWCTFNGDHMSMYGVNASVPKTLIRWIIQTISEQPEFAMSRRVLEDVLDTPISPELLPPDVSGKISQQTEDLVGPYALHDFFLYYIMRYGFAPEKIYTMACRAFRDDFDAETVKKWLKTFYRRFFSQQFKRNCMPDGVAVGSVGIGPRGSWKMPSDASGRIWLDAVDAL